MGYLILGAAAISQVCIIAWLLEELHAKKEHIRHLEYRHKATHTGYLPYWPSRDVTSRRS